MSPADAGNPYQAPEASIVAQQADIKRPFVYEAIAVFCWIIGGLGVLTSLTFVILVLHSCGKYDWRRVLLTHDGPRNNILFTVLAILVTATYINAGRTLWAGRGKPGLILCSLAMAMTYFSCWLLTWR